MHVCISKGASTTNMSALCRLRGKSTQGPDSWMMSFFSVQGNQCTARRLRFHQHRSSLCQDLIEIISWHRVGFVAFSTWIGCSCWSCQVTGLGKENPGHGANGQPPTIQQEATWHKDQIHSSHTTAVSPGRVSICSEENFPTRAVLSLGALRAPFRLRTYWYLKHGPSGHLQQVKAIATLGCSMRSWDHRSWLMPTKRGDDVDGV